jgi:hypothetical protein
MKRSFVSAVPQKKDRMADNLRSSKKSNNSENLITSDSNLAFS